MIPPRKIYVTEYYKPLVWKGKIVNITCRFPSHYNNRTDELDSSRARTPPLIWDVKKEVKVSTANNKPTESVSLNAFKQPKSFYLIFSIELWERFGYYGLQGIMAVYLVKQLGMSEADSITLFSSFSALVYGLVAIGGWLGDKVLGTKRVIMLGAIVLAIGYGLVAWSGHDVAIVYSCNRLYGYGDHRRR
ncbi:hypothetical protein HMPREF3207_04631 [Citrobacter koseri]|nr:hypothetical protein HMPREF3207_04631 [Citrobacter koseri]